MSAKVMSALEDMIIMLGSYGVHRFEEYPTRESAADSEFNSP